MGPWTESGSRDRMEGAAPSPHQQHSSTPNRVGRELRAASADAFIRGRPPGDQESLQSPTHPCYLQTWPLNTQLPVPMSQDGPTQQVALDPASPWPPNMPYIEQFCSSRSFCVPGQVGHFVIFALSLGSLLGLLQSPRSPPDQDLGRTEVRCPHSSLCLRALPCGAGGLAILQG